MTLLTENDMRTAFIALSRALDPREAPKPPIRENYINAHDFDKEHAKYQREVVQREGRGIEAAIHIAEELSVLAHRYVAAHEAIANALVKLANPAIQATNA